MKSILNFVPGHILLFYGLGLCFQFYLTLSISIWISVGLVFFLLVLLHAKWSLLSVFLISFLLGVISIQVHLNTYRIKELDSSKKLVLEIDEVLKKTNFSESYYATIKEMNNERTNLKIVLRIEKDSAISKLLIGDRLLAYSEIQEISEPKNPYSFDYKNYLKKLNIYNQVYLKKQNWKKLQKHSFSLKRIAFKFRSELIESLQEKINDKEVVSVMVALLLGEKQFVSNELYQNYANAGVVHILAISGLHIGILVLFLHFILRPLKRFRYGKLLIFVLMFVFLWGYAFLAGLSASVIRAVTMFSFVSFGLVLKNRSHIFHSLISSALFLLVVNPFFLFNLGFQMSYLAVFSIVVMQPMLIKCCRTRFRIVNYILNLITVSIAAQIGLLPLSLYYFHQFPGLFIISNVFILPCLGFVLVFGFVVVISAYVSLDIPIVYDWYASVVQILNNFIRFISSKEEWLFDKIYFSMMMMLWSYLLVVLVIWFLRKITINKIYLLGISIFILQLLCFFEFYKKKKINELIVYSQYKNSLLSVANCGFVSFYGADNSEKNNKITDYIEGTGLVLENMNKELPSILQLDKKKILIIDSLGVYKFSNFKNEIVYLQNSTKINLERCINILEPQLILMDGSTYSYVKNRWKHSCFKMNIPYHDTTEKGFFRTP